jgi:integrase
VSLYRRGKKWWCSFWVNGVRYQFSTGTGNAKLARVIAQKRQDAIIAQAHGISVVDSDIKLGELADSFCASGSAKPHYQDRLKQLLPFFAGARASRINKGMVEQYRLFRKSVQNVAVATVNRDLATLRRILNWGVEQSLFPSHALARLRLERERRSRRPVMSLQEEKALLCASPDHLKGIITAALDTGMRRGELLNQQWADCDLDRQLFLVTKSKTAEGEAREIPFTARLMKQLSDAGQNTGSVFTYRGHPIRSLKTSWKRAIDKAGIRKFRFHDLRHTYNTRLLDAGVMVEVRMALMGHSAGRSINAIYTHLELPQKREAIARLEAWINQQQQKLQEENVDADPQSERSESDRGNARPLETPEEAIDGRSRHCANCSAQQRDRSNGRAAQGKAGRTEEIRGDQEDLRRRIGRR